MDNLKSKMDERSASVKKYPRDGKPTHPREIAHSSETFPEQKVILAFLRCGNEKPTDTICWVRALSA